MADPKSQQDPQAQTGTVEVTEFVTKKYCIAQKIDYTPLAGAYRYRVEPSTNGLILPSRKL